MGRRKIITIGLLIVLLVVALLFAGADYAARSNTCGICHVKEASYANWLIAEKAKEGFAHDQISCASCHMGTKWSMQLRFAALLHVVQYIVPQLDARQRDLPRPILENIAIENCRYCHMSSFRLVEARQKDVPKDLKEIGLKMDHLKHFKAMQGDCKKCHERRVEKDGQMVVSKDINYAEINHMRCDACHKYVSHAYRRFNPPLLSNRPHEEAVKLAWEKIKENPRWRINIPSCESCRRCHNGRFHYKTEIFWADRFKDKNYDNCKKCHPLMTKEYFREFKARLKEGKAF
ncbi:MAG: hypothetical protein JRI46_05015 [Deltaproteobacteria bacterium]|nr:hypothetical protein [Deltaproteobacteria bacterium]